MELVSRPAAPTGAFEADAWGLSGVVGTSVPGGLLPLVPSAYLLRDGTGRRAMVRRHPDPVAEAIRAAISDVEVEQGDGRARPGRRDEQHPLLIEILTNAPLSVPLNELVSLADVRREVSLAGWLMACGLCPIPGTNGCNRFLAAADGVTEGTIKDYREKGQDFTRPFDEFLAAPSEGWTLFEIKLADDDRYKLPLWIKAKDVAHAAVALQRIGVVASSFTPPKRSPRQRTRLLRWFAAARCCGIQPMRSLCTPGSGPPRQRLGRRFSVRQRSGTNRRSLG
jgi:hypothetical protein